MDDSKKEISNEDFENHESSQDCLIQDHNLRSNYHQPGASSRIASAEEVRQQPALQEAGQRQRVQVSAPQQTKPPPFVDQQTATKANTNAMDNNSKGEQSKAGCLFPDINTNKTKESFKIREIDEKVHPEDFDSDRAPSKHTEYNETMKFTENEFDDESPQKEIPQDMLKAQSPNKIEPQRYEAMDEKEQAVPVAISANDFMIKQKNEEESFAQKQHVSSKVPSLQQTANRGPPSSDEDQKGPDTQPPDNHAMNCDSKDSPPQKRPASEKKKSIDPIIQDNIQRIQRERMLTRKKIHKQLEQETAYERTIEQGFNTELDTTKKKLHEGHNHQKVSRDSISAYQNQRNYLKSFGVGFEILSTIIQGGKFYKKDPRYSLQLLNYIIPGQPLKQQKPSRLTKRRARKQSLAVDDLFESSSDDEFSDFKKDDTEMHEDNTDVITHLSDGSTQQKLYHEQFEHFKKGIFLKLLFRKGENDGVEERGEVILGLESEVIVKNVVIKFSNNSRFLAIFMKELNIIKIIEIEEETENGEPAIEQAFKKLQRQEYYYEFPTMDDDCDPDHLKFVNTFQFGKSGRFLVMFGTKVMQILDLVHKKASSMWSLDDLLKKYGKQYEKIYDVMLDSSQRDPASDREYKCMVACKVQNQKKIDIFDIDHDFALEKSKEVGRAYRQRRRQMTFFSDNIENLTVKISGHFKKVVLVNRDENYVMDLPSAHSESDLDLSSSPTVIRKQLAKSGKQSFEEKGATIRRLPQLNDKIVRYIHDDPDDNFYFVACHDYDQSLDIVFSESSEFPIEFQRTIEPNIIKVYDMNIKVNPDSPNDKEIRIASVRDNNYHLDVATFSLDPQGGPGAVDLSKKVNYQGDSFSPVKALSAKWPYVTFSGLAKDFLIILNAYDKNVIHRIQMPDEPDAITHTYITQTNNLFIATSKGNRIRLQFIDLDASNRRENGNKPYDSFRVQNMFEYSLDQVERRPLLSIQCRGSSDKEAIDNNEKLIIFLLHQDALYIWKQDDDHKKMVKLNALKQQALARKSARSEKEYQGLVKLQQFFTQITPKYIMSTPSTSFYPLSDSVFYLLENQFDKEQALCSQYIVRIMADFSTYEKTTAFRDFVHQEEIVNFNVDSGAKKLIIFSKIKKEDITFKIYIFDIKNKRVDYESKIYRKELIGRLESGLYTLVDGHIYFNNHCIKIRYDLINQIQKQDFSEDEIFDFYYNILALKEGEKILTNCPMNSISYHKFVYIINNPKWLLPSRVVIVPYLHEKKIYLNRHKANTEYFYTSIETSASSRQRSVVCVNLTESKYYIFSQRGLLRNRIDYSREVKVGGQPISVSENGRNFLLLQKNSSTGYLPVLTVYHLTDYEFTYIKRINVMEDIENHINKLLNSQNPEKTGVRHSQGTKMNIMCGRNGINNWIWQHAKVEYEFTINNKMDIIVKMMKKGSKQKASGPVDLGRLEDPYDILDEIIQENLLEGIQNGADAKITIKKKLSRTESQNTSALQILNQFQPTSRANDQNLLRDTKKKLSHLKYDTVFYYQSGQVKTPLQKPHNMYKSVHNLIYDPESEMYGKPRIEQHFLYFADNEKHNVLLSTNRPNSISSFKTNSKRFRLNDNFALFWNDKKVWCIKLDGQFSEEDIEFHISQEDKTKCIMDVRSGSNPNLIAIVLHQSPVSDCVVTWNIKLNKEKSAFDVPKKYEILWDYFGYPYIVTEDHIIFTKEKCYITSYPASQINQPPNNTYKDINAQLGHRFDGLNHNWMIFNEYINLSFSYMTFLIKQKIEDDDPDQFGNVFDPVPFNYLFNRSTAFIDSQFVRDDHEQLEIILKNLYELDPEYLNLLAYTQVIQRRNKYLDDDENSYTIRNSPLHIATQERNNRAADIILRYLSLCKTVNSRHYMDIFSVLVEQKSFVDFLTNLQIQSLQMKDKQILKIQKAYKGGIAAIEKSKSFYIDERYYNEKMGEDKTNKQYKSLPVNVVALNVEWILQSPQGIDFLHALWESDNLELYSNTTVQILVEFLFSKFEKFVSMIFVPLNLVQIFFFELGILLGEQQYEVDIYKDGEGTEIFGYGKVDDHGGGHLRLIGIINFFLTLLQAVIMYTEYCGLRSIREFITMWRIFESLFICMSTILCFLQITEQEEQLQRRLSSFLVIVMFAKVLYYLKLIESLSRHIDIFFDICEKILSFMVLFIFSIFAFSNAYYMIGRNQMQYGAIPIEVGEINYSSFSGAVWEIYNLCLGGFDNKSFFKGDSGDSVYGVLLFCIASFVLLIHLLNMLIAIMGDAFAKNNEVCAQIKIQEQLRFVLDKWTYNSYVLGNTKDIKYVISAFILEDKSDESHALNQLQSQQDEMKEDMSKMREALVLQMKELKQMQLEQAKENQNLQNMIGKLVQ